MVNRKNGRFKPSVFWGKVELLTELGYSTGEIVAELAETLGVPVEDMRRWVDQRFTINLVGLRPIFVKRRGTRSLFNFVPTQATEYLADCHRRWKRENVEAERLRAEEQAHKVRRSKDYPEPERVGARGRRTFKTLAQVTLADRIAARRKRRFEKGLGL